MYLQYLNNFILNGKLFISSLPNPDYYGRMAESLFELKTQKKISKSETK